MFRDFYTTEAAHQYLTSNGYAVDEAATALANYEGCTVYSASQRYGSGQRVAEVQVTRLGRVIIKRR